MIDQKKNEQRILEMLGLEDNGQPVFVFTQSSHLDYDWVAFFYEYVRYYSAGEHTPVIEILDESMKLMSDSVASYYYELATVDFIRHALEEIPGGLARLQELQDVFCLIGSGLVTPDDLVSNGEAFIRNYLLGNKWAAENLPKSRSPQAWLPDNFGHSRQLPIVLEAMGLNGVGFARCPGADIQGASVGPMADELEVEGLGFRWIASDGSAVTAYFLPHGYNQRAADPQNLHYGRLTKPEDIGDIIAKVVGGYDLPGEQWRYAMANLGDDFASPQGDLLTFLTQWSSNKLGRPKEYENVRVVMANFDLFIQLLDSHPEQLLKRGPKQAHDINATPYWTGWYASRPAIKTLHQRATRALLGAETLAAICTLRPNYLGGSTVGQELETAWSLLAPTTSHNIITGCAPDLTTHAQQLPMLQRACTTAEALQQRFLEAIAAAVSITGDDSPTPDATDHVVVFNPFGFKAGPPRLVEIPPDPQRDISGYTQFRDVPGGTTAAVQATHEGGLAFQIDAPSLGYVTGKLTSTAPALQPAGLTDSVENEHFKATIGKNGELASLVDKADGAELIDPEKGANQIELWRDAGNIFRFANEGISQPLEFRKRSTVGPVFEIDTSGASWGQAWIEVLERGPVRQRIRTTVTAALNGQTYAYVREYAAVAGEPFLRMRTTGRAPDAVRRYIDKGGHPANQAKNNFEYAIGYSVMAAFHFKDPFEDLTYGTAYHWDDYVPDQWNDTFWKAPVFMPIHDFLTAGSGDGVAAMYTGNVHAWAPILPMVDEKPAMNGLRACLLRNTPGGYWKAIAGYGADGSDRECHTLEYAIRVPSGFQDARSGLPVREARSFQTSLPVAWLPPTYRLDFDSGTGKFQVDHPRFLKPTYSLAAAEDGSAAMITAAKPGTIDPNALVLRVYQPTNGRLPVTLDIDPSPLNPTLADKGEPKNIKVAVSAGSALEQEFDRPGYEPPEWPSVTADNGDNGSSVSLTMSRALATLQIKRTSDESGT